jgi:serine/threonine-protein kinase
VSSDFPRQASYAGRTSGRKAGEATVEIVIRNGAATAYLCDGKKLESWLNGDVSGSSMTLRGKGTNELTATLRSGTVSGTVSVNGVQWQFNAEPGKAPTAEKRADKAASVTAPNPARSAPAQSNPTPADPSPKDPAPTGYSDPYSDTATSAAGAGTSGAGQ